MQNFLTSSMTTKIAFCAFYFIIIFTLTQWQFSIAFRERERKRERKGKTEILMVASRMHQDWWLAPGWQSPMPAPWQGIKPATSECALAGNQIHHLSVTGGQSNQLCRTCQGPCIVWNTGKVKTTLYAVIYTQEPFMLCCMQQFGCSHNPQKNLNVVR